LSSASITACAFATSQVLTKFSICFFCSSVKVTQTFFRAVIHFIGSFNAFPTCIDDFANSCELGNNQPFIAVARSITDCVTSLKVSHFIFVNVSSIFEVEATTSLSSQFIFQSSVFIFIISSAVSPTVQPVDFITAFNCAVALSASTASFITPLKNVAIHNEAKAPPTFLKALLIQFHS
jgi:hypothetical protein